MPAVSSFGAGGWENVNLMTEQKPSTPNKGARPGKPNADFPRTPALAGPLPVLVIEDEKFLLSYFQAALKRGGVKSVGATSGGEALELLRSGEFAAVISDLQLPDGADGAEIFDWVRHNRPQLARHFMFITGDLQSSYAAEVRERTGATFLEKPFRMAQLLESVREIMARGETVHA